jgi:hypothetical protein
MNAYCPQCETELDQATGICPACRWDPAVIALSAPVVSDEPELSLTERYRGTRYDITLEQGSMANSGVPRGRAFVVVALVAGSALYGVVMSTSTFF